MERITLVLLTVFLDSDIDFTGETLEPIGVSDSNYFNGTFDGQGHAISNLNVTSSSGYVGLFGYSRGLTITNVVLDSSCSIISSYKGSFYAFVGGIIGECIADFGLCAIENSVNMGSVTFDGDISGYLYLGGISGYLSSYDYSSTVKNCANYGGITHFGQNRNAYIGGIVGDFFGSSSIKSTSTTPSTTAQSRTMAQHRMICTLEDFRMDLSHNH